MVVNTNGILSHFFSTNNELVQMLRVLGPLIKWLEIRFFTLAYEENLIGRGKFTLRIPIGSLTKINNR
jgi:hypothetical protein